MALYARPPIPAYVTGSEFARVIEQNEELRAQIRHLARENDRLRAILGSGQDVGCAYHYPLFVNGCSSCDEGANTEEAR